MKNRYILLLVAILFSVGACYEDKGNYDYAELNKITIERFSVSYSATLGETLDIYPAFTYALNDSSKLNLEYEWTFADKVIGRERHLTWVMDTAIQATLILRVKDLDTDVVYIQSKILRIQTPYVQEGWLVLSEQNGFSSLSYVRENDPYSQSNYNNVVYNNLYKTTNKEELGSLPYKVIEHKSRIFPSEAQILVIQQGGEGSIDLSGSTFQKEATLKELFLNQTYPVDFKPVNAMYMGYVNVIENADGRLFSRLKPTNELFNAGDFVPEPLYFGGDEIRGKVIETDWESILYFLVHDKGTAAKPQNRLLVVIENDRWSNPEGVVIKEIPVPSGGWPENFFPLTNMGDAELVYINYNEKGYYDSNFLMLLKDKNGQYWHQEFDLENYKFDLSYVRTPFAYKMPAGFNYDDCLFYACPAKEAPYVMIAQGSELYFYNRKAPDTEDGPGDGIKHYYSFDGNIVAMNADNYMCRRLAVALDNGKVVILNLENGKNLTTDAEKFFWSSEPEFGKIVHIRFKKGGSIG